MLIEFFGENFGCFRDEFRLSMVATDIDPDSTRGIVEAKVTGEDEPLRLLRCAAIYGANGSGKSTVVRAANALAEMIRLTGGLTSDDPIEVYEPFLGGGGDAKPTRLGLRALIAGAPFTYDISFDRARIHRESLIESGAQNDVTLMERVDQDVSGAWTSDDHFQLASQDFRPNALLLSLADRLAPGLARGIAVHLRYLLGMVAPPMPAVLGFRPRADRAAALATDDAEFRDWLTRQLVAADVGVTDFAIKHSKRKRPFRDHDGTFREQEADAYDLLLRHGDGPGFVVPYERESDGTRRLVDLAPTLWSLFDSQRPTCRFADELDASLHPTLLCDLVARVNRHDKATPGQLVFTTHETSLLDGEARSAVLRRDQVYLAEKDASGAATLRAVSDYKERQNVNIRRRYLHGRYGGVPAIGQLGD